MSHLQYAEGHCWRNRMLTKKTTQSVGPQGGEGGSPQWDPHWSKTWSRQNIVLRDSHTSFSPTQQKTSLYLSIFFRLWIYLAIIEPSSCFPLSIRFFVHIHIYITYIYTYTYKYSSIYIIIIIKQKPVKPPGIMVEIVKVNSRWIE